ncbi:hypothetical protein EBZ80_18750, partial [bacterium]|nr:hypothetical protein [bacterium]
ILMLAHKGVTQPGLWERWGAGFEEAAHGRAVLRYAVHSPTAPEYGAAFCRRHRLRGVRSLQTSWCSPSLVYAYVRCLDALLRDPQIRAATGVSVFLVSGYDIPIAPPSDLLKPCFRDRDHLCYIREKSHYQWIMVRRETVATIRDQLVRPEDFTRFFLYTLEHPGCSDEYMLRYVYTTMGTVDTKGCITRDFRPMINAPSPVVFNEDKTDLFRVTWGSHGTFTLSLREILLATRISDYDRDVLFFRKVGSYLDLSTDLLLVDILWDPRRSKKNLSRLYATLFPDSPLRFQRLTGALFFPVVTAEETQPRVAVDEHKKRERVLRLLQQKHLVDASYQGRLVDWYDAAPPQRRRALALFLSRFGFDTKAVLHQGG